MTPGAAKLLMCVCAGSTGAAIMPVAHKVHAALRPRTAVHQTLASPLPVMAAPCAAPDGTAPDFASLGNGFAGPGAAASGASQSMSPVPGNDFGSGIGGGAFAGGGGADAGGADAGDADAGANAGGSFVDPAFPGGDGNLPTIVPAAVAGVPDPAFPGLNPVPAVSSAPEPTSWALMIGGFGVVGGVMRWQRRDTVIS